MNSNRSYLSKICYKKYSTPAKIALLILSIYIFVALFASYLTNFSPDITSGERLQPPSTKYLLGTDNLSYDIWAQIAYGARASILVGLFTAIFSISLGSIMGIISGYYGGKTDKIIMRFVDILSSIPTLPIMILIAAFMGPKLIYIIIALSILSWTRIARLVRSQIIVLKETYHVRLAELYGASLFYLIRVHFLPEITPIITINMVRQVSRAIVAEASLSFIGLGDPLSSSWGKTLNNAMNYPAIYRTDYWKWWVMSPLMAIFILVFVLSILSKEFEKELF